MSRKPGSMGTIDVGSRARAALAEQPDGIYLNTAAEGLLLSDAAPAIERYLRAKARGSRGREDLNAIEDDARRHFASLISADASDVAFIASTSRGLDIAIKSIDWQAGDALVVPEAEFPTAYFAAQLLAERGVKVRVVPAVDGQVRPDDVVAAIDRSTKLVVMSLVSFKSGQYLAPDEIILAAHEHGALVYVDAVQALGAVPFAIGEVDFLAAASFKWMLGIHGIAGFYASKRARSVTSAPYVGYKSVSELFPKSPNDITLYEGARRYEEGMPSFAAMAVLAASLDRIAAWTPAAIDAHNSELIRVLRDGLRRLGARVIGPSGPMRTGGIVAFETPHFDRIRAALQAEGTAVWARDGRVRLSAHVYTRRVDIDTVLAQLSRIGVSA